MFGLSFAKLLVLVVAIAGIIALFRLVSVLKRQQELARRQDRDRPPRRTRGRTPNEQAQIRDMAACGRCGGRWSIS